MYFMENFSSGQYFCEWWPTGSIYKERTDYGIIFY